VRRALASLVLLAGAAAPAAAGGGPLTVVTTTSDLRALVEVVGGERVAVESLAPPLQDPHAVDVKPGQVTRLKAADLLVSIGLDHEPWLARMLRSANDPRFARGSPHYLDASRAVELLQTDVPRVKSEGGGHVHGFGNTHYWLDPENARPITASIRDALGRLAPADREGFATRRARFLERLDAGLARWSAALAPFRGTRVVVVHDTWPYFARRFGLAVVAVVEPGPGVPPSPASLVALSERMRSAGVKLIIAEPSANAALVARLAERSGARAVTLVPSVGGAPEASDYLALFDANVARLTGALAAR
jgi:ABC-type Zn uptake system ZnuABC Zn-binding protein ZnuA